MLGIDACGSGLDARVSYEALFVFGFADLDRLAAGGVVD